MRPTLKLSQQIMTLITLAVILGIALWLVQSLVHDRVRQRDTARAAIAQASAEAQIIRGPSIVIPIHEDRRIAVETEVNGSKKTTYRTERSTRLLTIDPSTFNVKGEADAQTRAYGIFGSTLYDLTLDMDGSFELPSVQALAACGCDANDTSVHQSLGQAYLELQVNDRKGLLSLPQITLAGAPIDPKLSFGVAKPSAHFMGFVPEKIIGACRSRLVKTESTPGRPKPSDDAQGAASESTCLDRSAGKPAESQTVTFTAKLHLLGTQSLALAPVGQSNQISLRSNWPHPSFSGDFLPRSSRTTDQGFEAQWLISGAATEVTQVTGNATDPNRRSLENSLALSVTFLDPVDLYKQIYRANKYGILFIALTFLAFFVYELTLSCRLHPIHYSLVGTAQAMFFLLLLSLSEHIGFQFAYLGAACACISLIAYYLIGILHHRQAVIGLTVGLIAIYACLYAALISQDNALLIGTTALFLALAVTMHITRRLRLDVGGGPVQ